MMRANRGNPMVIRPRPRIFPMIDFFRVHLKDSIFIKGFLGILMLSFGIWGVGDFIGTGGLDPAIAMKVGKTSIRAEEFNRRYTSELERLRQSIGADSANQPAIKRSIANSVVKEIS